MKKKKRTLKELLRDLGPGIISGAADHDPAGIGTYSVVGAITGFSQLWLALLSCPLLIYVLATCSKIGDVSKKGLGTLIKEKFGRGVSLTAMLLLLIANLTTLGADFAGVGAALNLLFPQIGIDFFPFITGFFLLMILILKEYKTIHKYLLFLSLIFVSYIFAGIIAQPNWGQVLRETFFPEVELSRRYFLNAVAFLGTTITPFLFYWQVIQELEDRPSIKDVPREFKKISIGMIFASLITYFVILTSAIAFFQKGTEIKTAADAALGLQPLMGNYAYLFFAVGLVASGLLAIMVIASSTAYAFAETFDWKQGLTRKPHQAKGFYAVLAAIFIIGILITRLGISPLRVIFYSQVLNGILAPLLLGLITILASSEEIMGKFRHRKKEIFLNCLTIGLMIAAAVGAFVY